MRQFDYEKLRSLRIMSGETLDTVADAIGVTKSALSLVETGVSNPRLTTILKLSDHFKQPLDFFLTEGATTVASHDQIQAKA